MFRLIQRRNLRKSLKRMRMRHFAFGLAILTAAIILPISFLKQGTIATYNSIRPLFLDDGGKMCVTELHRRGVKFTPLGDTGSANCPIKTAVRITTFKNTLPSSAFVLSCSTALNLDDWLAENRIKKFAHMGTISCRKMRGKGLQSEHSYGTAIDISTVDGASVQEDWGKDSSKGKKLKKVAESACEHFSNVLTPDTNSLHKNHFHFDNGFGNRCGAKSQFKLR